MPAILAGSASARFPTNKTPRSYPPSFFLNKKMFWLHTHLFLESAKCNSPFYAQRKSQVLRRSSCECQQVCISSYAPRSVDFADQSVLLCVIYPRVRKIRNEASSDGPITGGLVSNLQYVAKKPATVGSLPSPVQQENCWHLPAAAHWQKI